MDEYINREYLLDAMQAERERLRPLYDNYALGFEKGILLVKGFPCADVAPVRHCRWKISSDYGLSTCSSCGWNIEEYVVDYAYCPNCGAKMDGDHDG